MKNYLTLIPWKVRNYKSYLRGVLLGDSNTDGKAAYRGNLYATLTRPDGSKINYGKISSRIVTNAAVTYMRDDFNDGVGDINAFNFHDSGTGAVAENATDTALGTPAGPARVAGTKSVPATNQFRTVATIAYTATLAITEHGIFSASTAGTLLDRSVFAAINVNNGDSIQFTYTLTISGS